MLACTCAWLLANVVLYGSQLQLHDHRVAEQSAVATLTGDGQGINSSVPITCTDVRLASGSDDVAKSSLAGLIGTIETALAPLSASVSSSSGQTSSSGSPSPSPSIGDLLAALVARAKKVDELEKLLQTQGFAWASAYADFNVASPTNLSSLEAGVFTKVTSARGATAECSVPTITSVTLASFVTNIGNFAFSNCPITSIVIPDSVVSVGFFPFFRTGLTSLVINSTSLMCSAYWGVENCSSVATYPNGAPSTQYDLVSSDQFITYGVDDHASLAAYKSRCGYYTPSPTNNGYCSSGSTGCYWKAYDSSSAGFTVPAECTTWTCSSVGMLELSSRAECESAANAMGIAYKGTVTSRSADGTSNPYRCIYADSYNSPFDITVSYGQSSSCSGYSKCICKKP